MIREPMPMRTEAFSKGICLRTLWRMVPEWAPRCGALRSTRGLEHRLEPDGKTKKFQQQA